MFEQSIVSYQNRPWTLAASITLQCLIAAVIIITSIVQIQQLPLVFPKTPLPPVPRPPGPVIEVVRVPEAVRQALMTSIQVPHKVLIAPLAIPSNIAKIVDNLDEIAGLAPSVSASGSYDGVASGLLNSVPDHANASPPPAIKTRPDAVPRQNPVAVRRIEVGGKVQEAKLMHKVTPAYPALARSARISGKVLLSALIGVDGKIQSLKVISGHPLLVPASVAAVSQWVYAPTLLNDKPVEVSTIIELNFTITN